MTSLRPTRYSVRDDSTFFQVEGTLVSVRYHVEERRRWGVLPQPYRARLEIVVDDGAARLEQRYELPTSLKTGPELGPIERGLYGVIDEAIRTTMQLRAQESTEQAARRAESEHLFRDEGVASPDPAGPTARRSPAVSTILGELSDKLVTAVRHVSKVTSLTTEGLAEYERGQAQSYERILQSTSPEATLHLHGALRSVASFLEHEVEDEEELDRLKERARDYLVVVEERENRSGPILNSSQRRAIIDDFVPAYAGMLREHRKAGRVPGIVEHTLGSFFGGGISGFLVIDLFGESLIEGLAGIPVDLPGWWIGAGVAFLWPYLKLAHGLMTREDRLERKKERLLEKMDRQLDRVALPPVR
jgi:hypothetical protein